MLGWRHLTPGFVGGVCVRRPSLHVSENSAKPEVLLNPPAVMIPQATTQTISCPQFPHRADRAGLGRHKAGQQASGRVAAERHTSSNFLMSPSAGPAGPESLESASLGGRDLGGPVLGAGKPLTFLRNTLPKPSTLNPKPLNLKPLTLGPGCSVAASVGSASSGAPRGQRSSSSTEFRAS